MKDAETGQRGFLLTGAESYLSPYSLAKKTLPEKLSELRGLIADSADGDGGRGGGVRRHRARRAPAASRAHLRLHGDGPAPAGPARPGPPIVYTGHSLSLDEEQQRRRFSRSIIIKGVRSPERLQDEVTLFLHQVESRLPPEHQCLLQAARDRESTLEGRRILVVEDDMRNIFALSSVLEPRGAKVEIARNGKEALALLTKSLAQPRLAVDLVLMDIMMPEMDGLTATREIRKHGAWRKLPIIALTAKAMRDDQEKCLQAGANDSIARPLDVEKLLSLLRVWMPKG
uniref:response regulator n=1 Tax=Corallococcus coralloides TaxID=184914 RepID=UPI001F0BD46B|nr:response regulator [Corallococcus coralloides]